MAVVVHSEKLSRLIDQNAEVEQIATGFTFTEGPIWMSDGSLHFSDMPGDKRRRWHPTEGVTVLRDPSNKCNGMTLDNDGNLIVCEHVTSSVVREKPDGTRETLATHWQGKELNSPNDVIVASDGSIIFTDPTYGRMAGFGLEREQELDFQGVYRLPAGSRVNDAIQRAGGAGPKAELEAVNLAARLADGQQVVVPERGPAGAAAVTAAGADEGPIGLGTATVEQLDTIDGIGPVTAEDIVGFREEHGGLASVEQLDQISGIGPATMEALRARLQP